MTSVRSVRNTLSKARVNLALWSRSRNRVDNCWSFRSIVAFLACWVTQVESGWGCDAGGDDLFGAEVDEEQHVQGLQSDRLHCEEVTRDDPLGLGFEELCPGRPQRRGAGPSPWRRSS